MDAYADVFDDRLDAVANPVHIEGAKPVVVKRRFEAFAQPTKNPRIPHRTGGFLWWLRPASIR